MTEKTFICKVCGCQFTGRKKKYCGKECASRVEKIRTTNPEFLAKARVRSIKYRENLKKKYITASASSVAVNLLSGETKNIARLNVEVKHTTSVGIKQKAASRVLMLMRRAGRRISA